MFNQNIKGNVPNSSILVNGPPIGESAPVGRASNIHYHDELELIQIYEGDFLCIVGGKEYRASAGQVIFVNSRVPHETFRETPCRVGLLQFRESEFVDNEINRIIKYSLRFHSQLSHPAAVFSSPALFSALEELMGEARRKDPSYEMFIKGGVYRALGHLYREGVLSDAERLSNTREIQRILPILSYVNENYPEDITLERASEMLGFDRSYFCRIFKLATGATFTEYLNFVRICKAEKLLQKTRQSILETSETVGFSSVSYFNRIFRKYRNCSPRFYRTVLCSNM